MRGKQRSIGAAIRTLKLSFILCILITLLLGTLSANALQLNGPESQVPVASQASQPSLSTPTPPPPSAQLSSGNVEQGRLPDDLLDVASSDTNSTESSIQQAQVEMAAAATTLAPQPENQTAPSPLPPPPSELLITNKLPDQQTAQVPENPTTIGPGPVLQQVVAKSSTSSPQEGAVDQNVAGRSAPPEATQVVSAESPPTQTDSMEQQGQAVELPSRQSVDVTQAPAAIATATSATTLEGQNVAVTQVAEPSTAEVAKQTEPPKVDQPNQPVVDAAPQEPPQQTPEAAAAPVVEPSPSTEPVVANEPESAQPATASPQDLTAASQPAAMGDKAVVDAVPVVEPEAPVGAYQKESGASQKPATTIPVVESQPQPSVVEQIAGEPQGPAKVEVVELSQPIEVATGQEGAPIGATESLANVARESQTQAAVPVVESPPSPVNGNQTELPEVRENPDNEPSGPIENEPAHGEAKVEGINLTPEAGGAAAAAVVVVASQVTGAELIHQQSLNNTIAHHTDHGAVPELVGEKATADKVSENYYVIDPTSCGQLINNGPVVPEMVLNMTIERILRTIGGQDCGKRLAGSMKLRWATNRLIRGQVMEVSSVPLDMRQLMRSSRTRVRCSYNNDSSPTGTQEPKKVKFILSFEMEPADHRLRSRWRHYPKLRFDDIPLELFGRDSSKSSRGSSSSNQHYHSREGSSSKCQKFKLESGNFYLELKSLKTLLEIEVTLSKLNESAYGVSRHLGGQLLANKYKIKNLSLTHGINLDGSTRQLTGGGGIAPIVAPTVLIMHDNNNHHRRNSWLYNMYGNWIRYEYRNQLSHLLGQPLANSLNACFLD